MLRYRTTTLSRLGFGTLAWLRRAVVVGALSLLTFPARGQVASLEADRLDLVRVRAAAAASDPRHVQPEVLRRAAELRLSAIRRGALPQLVLNGEATIQSDVPELGAQLPAGTLNLTVPKEQYRVEASAEWSLFDGGQRRQQANAERARLDEQLASAQVSIRGIVTAATETYFAVLLLDARHQTLQFLAEALDARGEVVRARVRSGAALEADVAYLEAEHIRLVQQVEEAAAERRAALSVLAELTNIDLTDGVRLAIPDLNEQTMRVLARLEPARPELRRLDHQQTRIQAEARAIQARTNPTISLFGRGGVGRPSPLDFLSDEMQPFALAGVRVRWSLLDWGRTRRDAQAARLQASVVEAEREALRRQIGRTVDEDAEALRSLEEILRLDDRAISLRETVVRVAARQLDEGVILPDIYATRLSDLAEARLARERHRIEHARVQARILDTLGQFPGPP